MAKAAIKKPAKKAVRAKAPVKNAVKKATTAPAKKPARKAPPKRLTIKQRDRLLEAAMKVLGGDGFNAFTIAGVAKRAKLDLAPVKASFPTKLHLLAAALETNVEQDSDAAQTMILNEINFREDLTGAMEQMFRGQLRRHIDGGWLHFFANLDLSMDEPEHIDMWRMMEHRIGERGTRIVSEMQRRGYIDETLEPMWVQFFWNALMDGIGVRLRALPDGTGVDDVARALAPILLKGFAPKTA